MAARSTGIFPREGFNLDEEMKLTAGGAIVPANLYHAKTIRVIGINVSVDVEATIGDATVTLAVADADPNGVVIAHVRGVLTGDASPAAGTTCSFTGTADGVFLELVDGPRR